MTLEELNEALNNFGTPDILMAFPEDMVQMIVKILGCTEEEAIDKVNKMDWYGPLKILKVQ